MRWTQILALLLTFPLSGLFGMGVVDHWINPSRDYVKFEKRPLERTKPILMGGRIFFANQSGDVIAAQRDDGLPLWKAKTGPVEGGLTYARSRIYVGDRNGVLWALNAHDGKSAWTFSVQSEWLTVSANVRDVILAATSDDQLFAISETTGKEIWHYQRKSDLKITLRGTAGPVVDEEKSSDGKVTSYYVYQGFSDGSLVKLNALTGKEQWVANLKTKEKFIDVDAAPVVIDDILYVGTVDGNFYALDKMNAKEKWKYPIGTFGGFLVDNDRIYVSGLDSTVVSLSRDSGALKWRTSIGKGVGTPPSKAGEYLIVTTSEDPVYVLRESDGKIMATRSLGTGTLAPAAGHQDGWFYCISNFGKVYSYEILPGLIEKEGPKNIAIPSALYRNYYGTEASLTP